MFLLMSVKIYEFLNHWQLGWSLSKTGKSLTPSSGMNSGQILDGVYTMGSSGERLLGRQRSVGTQQSPLQVPEKGRERSFVVTESSSESNETPPEWNEGTVVIHRHIHCKGYFTEPFDHPCPPVS